MVKSTDMSPRRSSLLWALAALILPVTAVAALWSWTGLFDQIRSANGAWMTGYVKRILLFGDFDAAAWASQIPKVYYDSLYPTLIALLSLSPLGEVVGGPVVVGHVLAAAAFGLSALPLFAIWRAVGGTEMGVTGSLALLFPPMVTTACLIAADNLAIALVLLCGWSALTACRRRHWSLWMLSGFLAGTVYNCREHLLGSALGGLGVALLMHCASVRESSGPGWFFGLKPIIPACLACLAGILAGATLLPLALGHSPLVGVHAIFQYGKIGPPVGEDFHRIWYQTLYLDTPLALPLGLGVAGLVLAALRTNGRRRDAVLVLVGMILPYAAFPLSEQQSPQYYLLCHVLILSGLASFIMLIPWRLARGCTAVVLAALAATWAAHVVPPMVGMYSRPWTYYCEAWPVPAADVKRLIPWAMKQVGAAPLIVTGESLEHIREYFLVEFGHPVARVYEGDPITQYRDIAAFYGKSTFVLSMTFTGSHPTVPGAEAVGFRQTAQMQARLMRIDPDPSAGRSVGMMNGRGILQQGAWLTGGNPGLRRFAASASRRLKQSWFSPFENRGSPP